MEANIAAQQLALALRDDRLVALVGSGASARTVESSGREYPGLPTPTEFVKIAARQAAYLDPGLDFQAACDAVIATEGRAALETLLVNSYLVPANFGLPPAQRILSWLPFSLYVTSNFDQFVERALERERRHPVVLIENEDLVRIKRGQTPIVKYHGCVTRPNTLVAASQDYETLEESRGLIQQFITVSLANRTLLVIGHGLTDTDLSGILNGLLKHLQVYAPSIIVLREADHPSKIPGLAFRHDVVAEDLTHFLNRLLHEYRVLQQTSPRPFFDESWLNSSFFASLKQAAVLPSETQVIDAFLTHLLEELGARNEVDSVVEDASAAVTATLVERQNYTALRRTWTPLQESLRRASPNVADAELRVHELLANREGMRRNFRALGPTIVSRGDRILIYSQSQRVIDALLGVPQATQRTCELFISECRPKSPNPYQDAIAVCAELADSQYLVTVCPDVVAATLLATRQISKVMMGTHAIYQKDDGTPYAFVNTCGSLAIAAVANKYEILVIVIGEQLKCDFVPPLEAADYVHSHQESDLLQGALGLSELRTQRREVAHLNIGYDLVTLGEGFQLEVPDGLASPPG